MNIPRAHKSGLIAAIFAAVLFAPPASAAPIASAPLMLDVTYTNGSIVSGPLSFGLSVLPTEVNATFILNNNSAICLGAFPCPPYPNSVWGLADVLSASVTFGNTTWTALGNFGFGIDDGEFSLDYAFSPITTSTSSGIIILNFPLTITGTDIASGETFAYLYTDSTQALTFVPEPAALGLFGFGLAGLGIAARRRKTH